MLKSLHDTLHACYTNQLDNKDIAKEFIERNEQCRNYFKQF